LGLPGLAIGSGLNGGSATLIYPKESQGTGWMNQAFRGSFSANLVQIIQKRD